MNNPIFSWEKDNTTVLALHIPIDSGKYARTLLSGLSGTERYFFCVHSDGSTDRWNINGLADNNGKTLLYGNWKNLQSFPVFLESIKNKPKNILSVLSSLERAFEYYSKNFTFPPFFPLDYILVGPTLEVYLPSSSLNNTLRTLIPSPAAPAINNQLYFRLKADNPVGALFLLLARFLYTGSISDILRPPVLENREHNTAIITPAINSLLDITAYKVAPEPKKLLAMLEQEANERARESIDVNQAYLTRQEKLYQKRLHNTHEKKQKRKTIYIASGITLLVLLFIIFSFPKKDPLPIIPPDAVVREFYQAVDDLDHSKMSRYVKKNAASELVNEVIRLFVSSRMQFATEGKVSLVSPDEYTKISNDDAYKDAPPPLLVYGISDLNIETNAGAEDTVTFIANYIKWVPDLLFGNEPEENIELPPNLLEAERGHYLKISVSEKIILSLYKDGRWYIVSIQQEGS